MLGVKVSVLTVTKRDGWQEIAEKSLAKQTYRGFEWVVVTEQLLGVKSATVYLAPTHIPGNFSNLNASLNAGLRNCSGEYVVFYQDFIELEPDCLEKLVALADSKTFVTTLTRNPVGEVDDGRYTWQDEVRKCWPEEWEANVSIAPMAVIRELGGFDEEYDKGWSWDNVNIAERAEMLGCKFLLDETNRPQLLYHKKEPELNPDMPLNGDFHVKRMQDIKDGKFPLRLNYL